MFLFGDRFRPSCPDDCILMFRGTVNRIKFQRLVLGSIDDVVPESRGDDDCPAVAYQGFLALQDSFPLAFFDAQELVKLMHFLADFFPGSKAHEDELAVTGGVENFPEIIISQSELFDVRDITFHILMAKDEELRFILWPHYPNLQLTQMDIYATMSGTISKFKGGLS